MVSVCYPDGADWSCAYSAQELQDMRADPPTAALMDRADALAWATLASLTGYRVGLCPVTVRPCAAGCAGGWSYLAAPVGLSTGNYPATYAGTRTFSPWINGQGQWVNGCGCATKDCSCTQLSEAILPGVVGTITEVWLDGTVLAPSAYRVDQGNRLVRLDGGVWPACQDMTQNAHGEDAFSVTYYQGAAPDDLTEWAAGVLAVEFFKACQDKPCRLPVGVTSVSRQGVSYQITAGSFPGGFTGIHEVDAVIRLYNPVGLSQPPVVSSPDRRTARTTTVGTL